MSHFRIARLRTLTRGAVRDRERVGLRQNVGTVAVLGLLMVIGSALFVKKMEPAPSQVIDTQMRSGRQVTFVLIAPTTGGARHYEEQVRRAKEAVRRRTLAAGYHYSTVGISLDWTTSRGVDILAEFGSFDEVSVGRNWLNSGVKRYINDVAGEPVVPQVVIMIEDIQLDTVPLIYKMSSEPFRVVGWQSMDTWETTDFFVPLPLASQ